MTVRATVNGQPADDLRVAPSTGTPTVPAPGLQPVRQAAVADPSTEPLIVTPASGAVRPGDTVQLGGGSYSLELTGPGGTVTRQVVDGRLRIDDRLSGRYELRAHRGTSSVPAGVLYVDG